MNTTIWESMLALPVSPDRDHIRGGTHAPVTLVEYGDYECPYCGAAHQVVNALLEQMGNDLRYVFRNFPLTTMHPHAEPAAEVAEAAGLQRKFWPMHDTLYANQQHLEPRDLLRYADALGLDLNRLRSDLLDGRPQPKIREDFLSGVRSGVNGTPAFYINGRRHNGPWDFEPLMAALMEAAGAPVR